MSFQFQGGATPNKTTATGGLASSTPSTQATGTLTGTPTMTTGFGGFSLAAGDAKSTGLSFTPLGTAASSTSSGQKPVGFSLPIAATTTSVTSSTAPTAGGFSLSSITSTPASVGVAASSVATPLFSSQPAGSLKLGASATTTAISATTSVPATSQPAGQTTTPASLVTSTVVTSSAPVSGMTPSSMNFVQLEEVINKWTLELEEQEKMFINQATQINAWDRLLVNNSEKIVELNNSVENVKLQQQQLDYELDFILAQQRELEECLVPLEKELASAPVNIDPQREHMYHMADSLDTQLKRMSEDLKDIIDHLNESSKTQDNGDPIVQIGKILDAHMNSLQWIDEHILQIQNKLDEVSKLHDLHRRENERSFRLTYDYSGV